MSVEAQGKQRLERLVRRHGTQAKAAAAMGVSQQYVCALLKGRAKFSETVLEKLGLRLTAVAR